MARRSHSAFTLLEALVVTAIIATLVSLLLPTLQAARHAARSAGCLRNLQAIGIGIMQYAAAYDDYIPPGEFFDVRGDYPLRIRRDSWETLLINDAMLVAPRSPAPDALSDGPSAIRCPAGRPQVRAGIGSALDKYSQTGGYYAHSWYGCNGDTVDVRTYPMPRFPASDGQSAVLHKTLHVQSPATLVMVFDGRFMPLDFVQDVWPIHGPQLGRTNILFLAGHAESRPWLELMQDWQAPSSE